MKTIERIFVRLCYVTALCLFYLLAVSDWSLLKVVGGLFGGVVATALPASKKINKSGTLPVVGMAVAASFTAVGAAFDMMSHVVAADVVGILFRIAAFYVAGIFATWLILGHHDKTKPNSLGWAARYWWWSGRMILTPKAIDGHRLIREAMNPDWCVKD